MVTIVHDMVDAALHANASPVELIHPPILRVPVLELLFTMSSGCMSIGVDLLPSRLFVRPRLRLRIALG